MVKTPRTRSGGRKEPATIDLAPEDVRRVGDEPAASDAPPDSAPDSAEAAFAAEESLTPGERAAPGLLDAPESGAETVTPETAAAVDSFRFSEALPAEPPAETQGPSETGAPAEEPRRPAAVAEPDEESGPQPGDATTPLFADPPPDEERGAWPAPGAATAPREARPRTGRLIVAGFIGGAAALLLAALLQYLGALPSLSPDGRLDVEAMQTELQALRGDVASLRESGAAPDASVAAALDTLRADVAALQGGGANAQGVSDRLGALEGKVEGLGSNTVSADQIAALTQQAASAEAAAQAGNAAIEGAAKRLDALEGALAAMQEKVDAVGSQPRIALALAASGLKEAAERGEPFEAELATLGAIAPDLPEIAALQPYAAKGVATRAVLRDEWNAAADAMVATESQADPDAGLIDRLWSSATGLVSVRPIGAVEGASVAAVVARMEAALAANDLAKVLAEYDTLPDAAKQAGAAWAEKARARASAETLIDTAIASAMKGS